MSLRRRRQWLWLVESEKTGELVLEGLLIAENGRLVGQDGTHVSAEGLHILGNKDLVLLDLVPESIETVSECEHRVLEIGAKTRWGRRRGRLWKWWVTEGVPSVTLGITRGSKTSRILVKLILVRGFIARVVHSLRSWYTRFVTLDHYSFNGVYPCLIVL